MTTMFRRLLLILRRIGRGSLEDPVRGFQLSILALIALVFTATGVYMALESMSFTDALYMTVITISTVGFGEVNPLSPAGRLFTMALILLGVGIATTTISNAIGIILGPRLWTSIRQRSLERARMKLEGHYIVCGYGRMGRQIAEDLIARGEPFVVVDKAAVREDLLEANIPFLIGDATADETLTEAGVERARGLVAALNSDSDNVMTVLTARGLNPSLVIVSRVISGENESKLRRAGANRVVSPYQIGGHRLALALLRPVVSDFLDRIFAFHANIDVDIGQIRLEADSPLTGQTVASSDLRNVHNVSILAVQKTNHEIVLSPSPGYVLESGQTLIIIGAPENVYRLERDYRKSD